MGEQSHWRAFAVRALVLAALCCCLAGECCADEDCPGEGKRGLPLLLPVERRTIGE
ncbi:MAG: hypothetical protein R6V85_02675 [Polyangia bacterium]